MTLFLLILVVLINAGGRARSTTPSLQAVVPDLVPSDALEYGNGVLIGTEAATENLAGPVVGTWLFAMNKAVPFFADAIALVLSCLPLVGFRSKAPASDESSPSIWEGVRILLGRPPPAHPDFDGGRLGRPAGNGGRSPRTPGHDGVGGPRGRLRALPRRGRGRKPVGQLGGEPAGQAVRQRPDPDRCTLSSPASAT